MEKVIRATPKQVEKLFAIFMRMKRPEAVDDNTDLFDAFVCVLSDFGDQDNWTGYGEEHIRYITEEISDIWHNCPKKVFPEHKRKIRSVKLMNASFKRFFARFPERLTCSIISKFQYMTKKELLRYLLIMIKTHEEPLYVDRTLVEESIKEHCEGWDGVIDYVE